jgi:hypothetical protein
VVEVATADAGTKYFLGSVLNHRLCPVLAGETLLSLLLRSSRHHGHCRHHLQVCSA